MPRNFDLRAWDKRFASKEAFPDLAGEGLSSLVDEIRSWSLDQKQPSANLGLHIQLRIHKIYCDMKRNTSDFVHDQVAQHRVELLTYIKYEITKHRCGRFPRPEIASVFERLEALGHERIDVPDWFIPPYELRTRTGEFSTQDQFVRDMTRWYQLKHPHVEHLLGACHVGERFFLSRECGDFKDLSTALVNPNDGWYKLTKKPTLHRAMWQTLYKAALGLQFLHDRGIAHGNLDRNIVIPDGNIVKLRGLFWGRQQKRSQTAIARGARADAEMSKFADDVYGFGWCILEAVCGPRSPPKAFSSTQRSFLKSVLQQDPRDRIGTSEMVHQLKNFASEEEYGFLDPSAMAKHEESLITSLSSDLVVRKLLEVIRVALESTDALFSAVWPTNKQVFGRLTDIHAQLLIKNMNSKLQTKLWTSYPPILESFHDAVTTHAKEHSAIVRLASSRQASEGSYQVNLDLDRLCKLGSLSLARRDHDCQIQWNQNSASLIELLSTKVREEAQTVRGANDHNKTRVAGLAFLRFKRNQRHSRYTPDELSALESIIQTIHQDCGSVETTDPPWFIPPYEVDIHDTSFQSGGFGSVYYGRWKDAGVVVKMLKTSDKTHNQVEFFSEVSIWYQLNHPNIVELFSACHVQPAFFVCEHATNGELDTHLKIKVNGLYRHRSDTWHRLCDAANGLRYLHERGIVHGDLKCNNILIGSDGLAKLADFGLSSFKLDFGEAKTTGAERWMAPEILNGNRSSSFASDIYSFGMCVIEAVSGDIPWPQFQYIVRVRRDIKKGILPVRPERFHDDNQLRQTDEA